MNQYRRERIKETYEDEANKALKDIHKGAKRFAEAINQLNAANVLENTDFANFNTCYHMIRGLTQAVSEELAKYYRANMSVNKNQKLPDEVAYWEELKDKMNTALNVLVDLDNHVNAGQNSYINDPDKLLDTMCGANVRTILAYEVHKDEVSAQINRVQGMTASISMEDKIDEVYGDYQRLKQEFEALEKKLDALEGREG